MKSLEYAAPRHRARGPPSQEVMSERILHAPKLVNSRAQTRHRHSNDRYAFDILENARFERGPKWSIKADVKQNPSPFVIRDSSSIREGTC